MHLVYPEKGKSNIYIINYNDIMYAIVEIAGQQFKVAKDQKIFVHRLQGQEGDVLSFDKVLLASDGDQITLGAPVIENAQVGAKIVRHLKGDKVIVFKKKRRKGYRTKNGHRQSLTEISIEDITLSGASKSEKATKPAEKPSEVTKVDTTKDDLKKIEGIGPKIEEVLNANGITTFEALSKADPKQVSEFIKDVRGNHVTDTWSKQALLAFEGKWDELKEWQDKLDGGVEK